MSEPEMDKPPADDPQGEEAKTPPEAPAPNGQDTPQEPQFKMPIIPAGQMVLDRVSGMLWVGIPLSRTPLLDACIMLDRVKTDCAMWHHAQANRPKLVKPGMVRQFKDFFGRIKH